MNQFLRRGILKGPWLVRYRYGAQLASDLRRILIMVTHRHCRVEFTGAVRLGPGFSLHIPERGTLVVGNGVDFRRGFYCEISGEGRVTIGDGCSFTSNAMIQCSTSIDIGSRCAFAQSVHIVDGSHRFRDPSRPVMDQGYDFRPISIGDNVWVASKCTIAASVGEGTVVGAHSLVSRPLPSYCLAVGTPATPVEFFDGPASSDETCDFSAARETAWSIS